ncbi:T9SS type A sorting domain-containing protein [candidate division KSB1 bacterium]|nr:T9SS type A sorting domain-containing protein [candidate division KSB1 bacterium]
MDRNCGRRECSVSSNWVNVYLANKVGKAYGYGQVLPGQICTQLQQNDAAMPDQFVPHQNYPNPFNPTTIISYRLPIAGNVKLSIFNSIGQRIATLVSGEQPAGVHRIEWDATDCASGIYVCRLQTGSFSATQKMLLIR